MDNISLAAQVLEIAQAKGATDADVIISQATGTSTRMANGELERSTTEGSHGVGLRVFMGKRQSVVSFNVGTKEAVSEAAQSAIARAKILPEDPYCGLAPASAGLPAVDDISYDAQGYYDGAAQLADVKLMESIAMAIPQIERTWAVEASSAHVETAYANTQGFSALRKRTYFSRAAIVVAAGGGQMQRDYESRTTCAFAQLPSPQDVAEIAVKNTVSKLHARPIAACQVPVIFTPRIMRRVIGYLVSALSGSAIVNQTSFLRGGLGTKVCSDRFTLIDDPTGHFGVSSRLFDAEGVACHPVTLIQAGVVNSWILDLRSSRYLGLKTLGHAVRSLGGLPAPSPSHVVLKPDTETKGMIKSVPQALMVDEFVGSGLNPVTGDFSLGVSGYWVENGEICHSVNQLTIAGQLQAVLGNMVVGDDLSREGSIASPTCMSDGMTISGSRA